jgi:hypothetical protein
MAVTAKSVIFWLYCSVVRTATDISGDNLASIFDPEDEGHIFSEMSSSLGIVRCYNPSDRTLRSNYLFIICVQGRVHTGCLGSMHPFLMEA